MTTPIAPWTDPDWLASVHAWLGSRLAELGLRRTGAIEQPHVRTWSTVLRVPTDVGAVWFKANEPALRHEAAVVRLVSERFPDRVPPLLAVDLERGWMLMADAGEKLRAVVLRERSLARWVDVLEAVGRIQVGMADRVEDLLAAGVPDLRLHRVPAAYDALMDALDAEPRFRAGRSRVEELCGELGRYGIAETLQHDDLHDAQVFVLDDRQLVLDWGDACVSHPFFTLSVTLEGQISWGLDDEPDSEDVTPYRDAYLTAFAETYDALDRADLVEATRLATRLGWAVRAVNGHVVGDRDATLTRLRMFLDGRP